MLRFAFISVLLLAGVGLRAGQDSLSDRIRSAQSSGNYAEAARLYGELIASGNDTPELRSNRGIMLHLAGKNREALGQFRAALSRNPNLVSAQLFSGLAEIDLGEPKAALLFLERARDLDPSRAAPLLALGSAHVALHDYARANQNYSQAAKLDGSLAEAWYGVGVTDRSLAEERLNSAARQGRARDEATRLDVKNLLDGALTALTRAVELDPDSARTHLIMAESLSDAGKMAEAVPEYQAAMKLDPALEAAYLGLASEYWKQHQFDEALPLVKHVLAKSPRDPEANGILADILQHNGDNAAAKLHAVIALAGNPELIQTHVVLARIYLAGHEPKLAIAELRKVTGADTDGSYHFLLYRAYREAGDAAAARQAMAEFQQLKYGNAQP